MADREMILDAMQRLVLASGRPPSIQAVAQAVGLTKQGVLHHFPDRASLDAALVARAVARTDAVMSAAARNGSAAETYLRLSDPSAEDRAVALVVLSTMRRRSTEIPPEVAVGMARWEALIAEELGDPGRAEVVRLVGDGLFAESLVTGAGPGPERLDRLVSLLGPQRRDAS